MPDVIERRECPECGADGDSYAENAHWSWCARGGVHVTRRYVAVDALLREDVVEAAAEGMAFDPGELVKWADRGAEDKACWTEDARAALAAAVEHLTGGER